MRRSIAWLVLGGAALALPACGGGTSDPAGESPTVKRDLIAAERPPRPRGPLDVASRAQERRAEAAAKRVAPEAKPAPGPEPAPEAKGGDPSSIPPASAGTNGSFKPSAAADREAITPRTMERLEAGAEGPSAILLGGIALAPPNAPEAIKAAITAANEIVGRPYIWGGGHGSWYSRGYDCSGAVSYALGGGGFLGAPLDSTQLESWGDPGPGRWLTVYANAGHAYAVIAGLRWDTVGDARGTGPRWHPAVAYPEGFVARHPPGF